MKTLFRIVFLFTGLMLILAVFGGIAVFNHMGPDTHIVIGDEELFLGGSDFGDWVGAVIGLFVAGMVCVLVVPLVLLLGVALPLLIVGGVIAAVFAALAGVGALLGSPLILLGLLVFVVLRNRRRAMAAMRVEPVASRP